ncbi:HotDog domain-containing protein [Xylaria flabelliformis]|nr:HotDog domain-containing protein [Xylaria flabelliformis]
MLRSPQRLCRQGLVRSIGRPLLRENSFSACLRTTILTQARRSQGLTESLRSRRFGTSRSRLAEPSKPPAQAKEVPTASTIPAPEVATETQPDNASPTPSPSPSPQRPKRRRRGLYYAALFLLLGTVTGTLVRITISPPALPTRGSDQDIYLQQKIQAQGARLSIVQQLSADPSWTSWEAYAGIPETASPDNPRGLSAAQSRITSGPMSGSSGLAFQRIFHNASTGEVVTVVYFGAGVAGWPGVVHGGALATVLDESLGRCAILRFPSRTGVTANLDLQYRAPTLTNNFYVIRTRPVPSEDDDVVGKDGIRKGDRKLWVRGTLETEKGKVAVDAKGLFVVPRTYKLRPLVEGF